MKRPSSDVGALKRPAAAKTDGPSLKRPASINSLGPPVKKQHLPDFLAEFEINGAKGNADDDDDDVGNTVSKYEDVNTWKRMKRHFDNNEADFEPWLKKMYDDAKGKSTGSRAAVRKIIEEAVEKLPSGKYRLCVSKPFFSDYRTKYDDQFASTEGLGLTRTFMIRERGGEEQFKAAVESGELEEYEDEKGMTFYKKITHKAVRTVGRRHMMFETIWYDSMNNLMFFISCCPKFVSNVQYNIW